MRPASIQVHESEALYADNDLDYEYIDGVASDLAAALSDYVSAQAAYQPGDGTFYAVVLTPLKSLSCARPRVKKGPDGTNVVWETLAVRGVSDSRGDYLANAYLLSLVGNTSYPIRLGCRAGRSIASDYVSEHWFGGKALTSAVSVTVLLRAISFHLDRLEDERAEAVA